MPESRSGHSPRLDVGVALTSGDDNDHPAAESAMMFVLSAVVPWAFRDAKALQGVGQQAGEARRSLAVALESLGVGTPKVLQQRVRTS